MWCTCTKLVLQIRHMFHKLNIFQRSYRILLHSSYLDNIYIEVRMRLLSLLSMPFLFIVLFQDPVVFLFLEIAILILILYHLLVTQKYIKPLVLCDSCLCQNHPYVVDLIDHHVL